MQKRADRLGTVIFPFSFPTPGFIQVRLHSSHPNRGRRTRSFFLAVPALTVSQSNMRTCVTSKVWPLLEDCGVATVLAGPLTYPKGLWMPAATASWRCLRARGRRSRSFPSSWPTSNTIQNSGNLSTAPVRVLPPQRLTRLPHADAAFAGTMSEIEKALAELKSLMKYRAAKLGHEEDFRGLGLTSRKNLCLHPSVKREKSGNVVDARCRSLTAGFVKEKKERGENVDVCIYHDV